MRSAWINGSREDIRLTPLPPTNARLPGALARRATRMPDETRIKPLSLLRSPSPASPCVEHATIRGTRSRIALPRPAIRKTREATPRDGRTRKSPDLYPFETHRKAQLPACAGKLALSNRGHDRTASTYLYGG